jgi:integrase
MPVKTDKLSYWKFGKRWRKRYKNKEWIQRGGPYNKTDKEAEKQAEAAYQAWKVRIDAEEAEEAEAEAVATSIAEMQGKVEKHVSRLRGLSEMLVNRSPNLAGHLSNFADNTPELTRIVQQPASNVPLIEGFAVQALEVELQNRTVDQSKVLSVCASDFDIERIAELKEDKIGVSQYNNTKRNVNFFIAWIGNNTTEAITEDTLPKYRAHLLATMNTKRNAEAYYNSCRHFVNWCYMRNRLAALPRNFKDAKLAFQVKYDNKKFWTEEEWKAALEKAPERLRLYLLLMLNCGMYQGDIGELLDSEVDWKVGRISRKRSKSGQDGTWLLWPETFRLLKKYRSGKELVFLSETGDRIYLNDANPKTLKHIRRDDIGDLFGDFVKATGLELPTLMHLRKTGANALAHKFGRSFSHAYLAHANRDLDDKSYVGPPPAKDFDAAIKWLGKQFPVPPSVPR